MAHNRYNDKSYYSDKDAAVMSNLYQQQQRAAADLNAQQQALDEGRESYYYNNVDSLMDYHEQESELLRNYRSADDLRATGSNYRARQVELIQEQIKKIQQRLADVDNAPEIRPLHAAIIKTTAENKILQDALIRLDDAYVNKYPALSGYLSMSNYNTNPEQFEYSFSNHHANQFTRKESDLDRSYQGFIDAFTKKTNTGDALIKDTIVFNEEQSSLTVWGSAARRSSRSSSFYINAMQKIGNAKNSVSAYDIETLGNDIWGFGVFDPRNAGGDSFNELLIPLSDQTDRWDALINKSEKDMTREEMVDFITLQKLGNADTVIKEFKDENGFTHFRIDNFQDQKNKLKGKADAIKGVQELRKHYKTAAAANSKFIQQYGFDPSYKRFLDFVGSSLTSDPNKVNYDYILGHNVIPFDNPKMASFIARIPNAQPYLQQEFGVSLDMLAKADNVLDTRDMILSLEPNAQRSFFESFFSPNNGIKIPGTNMSASEALTKLGNTNTSYTMETFVTSSS